MLKTAHLYTAVAVMTLANAAVFAAPAMAHAQQVPDEQAITRSLNQRALNDARNHAVMQVSGEPGMTHAAMPNANTAPPADNIHAPRTNPQSPDRVNTDLANPDSAANAEDDANGSSIDNNDASSEMPLMVPDGQPNPLTADEPGSPGDNPNTPQ
jgi:hypothetical protein